MIILIMVWKNKEKDFEKNKNKQFIKQSSNKINYINSKKLFNDDII